MANIITGIRIVCALLLIFCPVFSIWFYMLYILGGISDVLDGIAARHFGRETKFGANFDTIADTLFTVTVIIKAMSGLHIPLWLIIWIAGIAFIKCTNIISGLVIYRRFVSEHTVMNKICGILLFAIPLCIGRFPWLPVAALIIPACAISTIAAIQEGYYIHTGQEIG